MFFFRKKVEYKKPELISVHVSKTAGTSFYHTLKNEYKSKNVVRLDITPELDLILLDFEIFTGNKIETNYKVIHGHFSPNLLYNRFPEYQQIPIITWVRNPVDRVISNYYYLAEMLKFYMKEHEVIQVLLDKMEKTLEEFIDAPINQNRTAKALDGLDLTDFNFIGIVENYDAELAYLSKLLNWKNVQKYNVNATEKRTKSIDLELRKKIELANLEDMAIYEKVRSLKSKRKSI